MRDALRHGARRYAPKTAPKDTAQSTAQIYPLNRYHYETILSTANILKFWHLIFTQRILKAAMSARSDFHPLYYFFFYVRSARTLILRET